MDKILYSHYNLHTNKEKAGKEKKLLITTHCRSFIKKLLIIIHFFLRILTFLS